jgi:acetyltransferase-like isoleucine patch superfamily enzyme
MIRDVLREIWNSGIKELSRAIILTMIRNIDGPFGERLRYAYFKRQFRSIGDSVRIDAGVFIYGAQYISIGNNVHIDKGVIIVASGPDVCRSMRCMVENNLKESPVGRGELIIGDDVHISRYCGIHAYGGVALGDRCVLSDNCKLYSLTNLPWNPMDRTEVVSIVPYSEFSPSKIGQIELQANVWLGLNCIVMPGVQIGKDSFARTNSVITESCPRNSYLRGDPAIRTDPRYDDGATGNPTLAHRM